MTAKTVSVGHGDVVILHKDVSLVTFLKLPENQCLDRSPQEDASHACWKVTTSTRADDPYIWAASFRIAVGGSDGRHGPLSKCRKMLGAY